MTVIEITKRIQTVLQRAIEVKWDKFVAEGERIRHTKKAYEQTCEADCNCADGRPVFYKSRIEGLCILFEFDFTYYHDDGCHMDGMIDYDDDCHCEKEVNYQVKIKKDDCELFQGGFSKTKTTKYVQAYFDEKLPTSFTICQCEEVATIGMWCDECYIKRQHHPEDKEAPCAICHDYEGAWVKTDCNHYFHKSCFTKIDSTRVGDSFCRKCPLCRNMVNNYRSDI